MTGSRRFQRRTGHLRVFVHAQESATLEVVGVGIALKDGANRAIDWLADQVLIEPGSDPLFSAVEQGLELAARLGARTVAVFVDDADVVRRLNRDGDVPRESVRAFMRVRALMNQVRKVSVRYVTPEQNREARRLAEAAAANEVVGELPQSETLSLFPAVDQ